MAEPDDDFRRLLEQARAGSQEAARELIRVYAPHVLRAIRRRMHKAIRGKFDSVDFAQSVWASFFALSDQIQQFDDANQMVAFLTKVAYNKVIDEIRRRMETQKYNVRREWSLDDPALDYDKRLVAPIPSPSQVIAADDLWIHLLEGCDDRYRAILELRRLGHTHQQIADRLGVNERTVRRVIDQVVRERIR